MYRFKTIAFICVIFFITLEAGSQIIIKDRNIINNSVCNGEGCSSTIPPIVFNEIHPTPLGSYDGSIYDDLTRLEFGYESMRGEWIELYNPDNCRWADLSYCFLGNSFYKSGIHKGACFEFPMGTGIPPRGYLVVRGTNAPAVPSHMLYKNGGKTIEVIVSETSYLNLEDFRLWLPNLGGWIALYDKYGNPMDAVTWNFLLPEYLDGKPSTPIVPENFYNGPLASYNEIPNNKKNKIINYTPLKGYSYRRIPDGKNWIIDTPVESTYGYCNGICDDSPYRKCNGSAGITIKNGTPPYNYLWDDSARSSSSVINNLCPGTYHVTVTDSRGFSIKDSVVIMQDLPVLNLGNDSNYCSPFNRILNANNPGAYYFWSTGELSQTIKVKKQGIYHVEVTTSNFCSVSDTINITQSIKPNIGEDTSTCQNQKIILDAGPQYKTYQWPDGSAGQNFSPKTSGTYIVQVKDKYNCILGDTVIVNINPLPIIDLGNDTTYCKSRYTLNAGAGFSKYIWSNGSTQTSIIPELTNFYWVEVTDKNNCAKKDTIKITINPYPNYDLGPNRNICEGDSTIVDIGQNFNSYSWSSGTGNREIILKTPNKYFVTVTNEFNCSTTDSIEVAFFPKTEITSIDTSINGQITIFDTHNNLPHQFSVDKTNFQFNNVFTHLKPGAYVVTLIDINNCKATASIELFEDNIRIPNYFTPNNDSYHDTWEIDGISSYPQATIQIFDRFGKLLTTYKGQDTGWDGTYKSLPAKSDDYWYIVNLNYENRLFTGHVTLKR